VTVDLVRSTIADAIALHQRMSDADSRPVVEAAAAIVEALMLGGKLLLFGNGGSAADAQHVAAELVGRFQRERAALAALALTTDTSVLTSIGNDYGYDRVFARQIEALAKPGDLLIIHTTSGNSPNLLRAAEAARGKKVPVLAFSAREGGKLKALATHNVIIPTDRTDRAQELQLCIEHVICDAVEREL